MVRFQVSLSPEDHRCARQRAQELGISLAEYVRRTLAADLRGPEPQADISGLFDLGASGGSDIARHKDEYIGEAVEWDHRRKTGGD